jgi:ectoine hydrolase
MIEKDIPFSTAEYQRRLLKTRRAMEARGIDVMFCTDPSNQNWLTAYDGWSFYVHQGVLVFPDADPVWWGRSMDANGGVRTVWMEDARWHRCALCTDRRAVAKSRLYTRPS